MAVECFVGPGCGTLMSRDGAGPEPRRVYRGVRWEAEAIHQLATESKSDHRGSAQTFMWCAIADFPITAAADTVILPFELIGIAVGTNSPSRSVTNARPSKAQGAN